MTKSTWNRREKTIFFIGVVISVIYMGSVTYFVGQLKIKDLKELAKNTALVKYAALKAETDGDKAVTLRNEMIKMLTDLGLGLDSLHIERAELDKRVEGVYYRQTLRALTSLEALKGDPAAAEELRKEFFRCRKLAGPEQIQADEYVHRLVAINYLGKAGLQGIKLDVADLKKAGIIVNAVYHPDERIKNRESINKAIAAFNERHKNQTSR